jgi:hypothetical protein
MLTHKPFMFVYTHIYIYIYKYTGGTNPDKSGKGLKPFMVNEMTMLAHYHHKMGEGNMYDV